MSWRGGGFGMRLDDEGALQLRGAPVHDAGADHGMPLKLAGEGFQEGVSLVGMDRRRGLHDGVVLVIGETERHGRPRGGPGAGP